MPGPNLLAENEATFETGISSSWVRFAPADATLSLQASGGHTGSNFMQLIGPTTNGLSILAADLTRDIPVDSTTEYAISGWLRTSHGSTPGITIFGLDAGGSIVSSGEVTVVVSASTWGFATGTVLLPLAVKARLRVRFDSGGLGVNAGDTLDVDDLFFGLETAPILSSIPEAAFTAEVRSEARLVPGIRMDGG